MNWINVNEQLPNKYEEVIVATLEGSVKATMHVGNGKFATYLTVTHWMPMPEAPTVDYSNPCSIVDSVVKKKRGRPRKNVEGLCNE